MSLLTNPFLGASTGSAAALALARRAVTVAEDMWGPRTPRVMGTLVTLGMTEDFAGDSAAAERTYALAVEAAGDEIADSNVGRIIAARGVTRGLSRQGRHQEAEAGMLELLDRTPAGAPAESAQYLTRQATLRELAAVYRRWGREEDARRYEAVRASEADTGDSP